MDLSGETIRHKSAPNCEEISKTSADREKRMEPGSFERTKLGESSAYQADSIPSFQTNGRRKDLKHL